MKKIATLIFIFFCHHIQAQTQEHAWVYFKNKPNATYFLENPHLMLTAKALHRRSKQNISIDQTDVPLYPNYVSSVATALGITVKAKSKWLNALHVIGTQTAIDQLKVLSFVNHVEFANKTIGVVKSSVAIVPKNVSKTNKLAFQLVEDYGQAQNQITMIGVDAFHNLGYQGQDYQIAVMDAGFHGVNTAGAFSHLVDNNQTNGEVLGGYNYVDQSNNFYANTGDHGTMVLSTMGAVKKNEFSGTSPKASFYLFVTEDINSETPLEESYWVQAAEKADSLGVDIINSSLGYNQFDESKYNYTYADMDGETSFITLGANIAAQKGIIVVNSVGNSGYDSWKYVTAPADAKNIISVGAVNQDEFIAGFSSFGPSADNRIKPETLAQGFGVYVVDQSNSVISSNGTSFSGPIIAGATACLWQAYPNKTNLEIRQMIIENSKDFLSPTNQGGYGVLKMGNLAMLANKNIPLEKNIDVLLSSQSKTVQLQFDEKLDNRFHLKVFSVLGTTVVDKEITSDDTTFSFANFSSGLYYMQYDYADKKTSKPLMIP